MVTLVLKSNNTVTPAKVLLTRMDDHPQPITTVSFQNTSENQEEDVVTESPNDESILTDYETNSNVDNLTTATVDI